jgi:hypothetical protein
VPRARRGMVIASLKGDARHVGSMPSSPDNSSATAGTEGSRSVVGERQRHRDEGTGRDVDGPAQAVTRGRAKDPGHSASVPTASRRARLLRHGVNGNGPSKARYCPSADWPRGPVRLLPRRNRWAEEEGQYPRSQVRGSAAVESEAARVANHESPIGVNLETACPLATRG